MIARPWTDDLPKCKSASVASGFNRVGSGTNNEESLCFYCQAEDNSSLYGVFEPQNGVEAAQFIMQRMAVELLFPPPAPTSSDEEIRDRLRNAFTSVEKAYIENYDEMIAERTSLQYQLPPNMTPQQFSNTENPIVLRLREIDQHLSGGVTVAIALVVNNKLFVANVGEIRALLCRTDDNSVLRVVQLTVDHSLNNEDELLRLSQLGLDINKLRNVQYLGNQTGTRCLGNYLVKGLHKAFPLLCTATSEPIISTCEIHGPIALDHYSRFLVLVSASVYKRIQESRGSSEQTNKQLAQIIVENFRKTDNFKTVSQSVLQEIEEEFITYCYKNNLTPKHNHMSLIIRNFNFPLPNVKEETVTQSNPVQRNASVRFNPIVQSKSNTLLNEIDTELSSTNEDIDQSNSIVDTNKSIDSTSDIYPADKQYDRDRKIEGYVDFSCYFENVAKARKNGTLPSFIK
ncbi:TGF-beta-activated kinase 1 and MAP3K7-binding protein 1-like [Hyposmocoma kahamanoa]|uniref:TGF-beta-activated kinase 1 and MAP3K7-binding protein 1-like n=1 Tax=Hyposmocoma kahamanoa TaxID=1477025 RepID=UPI000E6D7E0D|nr:TGF-beta-activated kinase 1 and MAP3K7-binding protein 1-like [Hyposmocoma kahamanoa]